MKWILCFSFEKIPWKVWENTKEHGNNEKWEVELENYLGQSNHFAQKVTGRSKRTSNGSKYFFSMYSFCVYSAEVETIKNSLDQNVLPLQIHVARVSMVDHFVNTSLWSCQRNIPASSVCSLV